LFPNLTSAARVGRTPELGKMETRRPLDHFGNGFFAAQPKLSPGCHSGCHCFFTASAKLTLQALSQKMIFRLLPISHTADWAMVFGDPARSVVSMALVADRGGAWLCGRLCYWINGQQFGTWNLGSARPYSVASAMHARLFATVSALADQRGTDAGSVGGHPARHADRWEAPVVRRRSRTPCSAWVEYSLRHPDGNQRRRQSSRAPGELPP